MLLLNSLVVSPVASGSFSDLTDGVLGCPLHDVKTIRMPMRMILCTCMVCQFEVYRIVMVWPDGSQLGASRELTNELSAIIIKLN